MTDLTLDIADRIASGTLAAGLARKAQPLTVVVLDAGGHVVVAKRADGSGILRIEIATGKAYGALGFGLPSRVLFKRAADNPNFFNAVAMASGGRLVPNAGACCCAMPAAMSSAPSASAATPPTWTRTARWTASRAAA
jgi:uncharacterized protein GlcG (DUF336 family)